MKRTRRRSDPLGFLTEAEALELAARWEREAKEKGLPPLRIRKPGELSAKVAAAGGWEQYKKQMRK